MIFKLSEIEQKISKLENLIGINEHQSVIRNFHIFIFFISYILDWIEIFISKSNNLKNPFLFLFFKGSLEQLTTRINLLDGTNIDHIDTKLGNVLQRLNAINEKKTIIDEQDKQSKVKIKNFFLFLLFLIIGCWIIRYDVTLGNNGSKFTNYSTTFNRSEWTSSTG